jgi:hypothetical protein
MTEPRRVPSSIFRLTYAALDESVAVTVLGRVIGWWTPVPRPGQEQAAAGEPVVVPGRTEAPDLRGDGVSSSPSGAVEAPPARLSTPGGSVTGMTQAAKDRVLRKVATR